MKIDLSHIPNGNSGIWSVSEFEVPENDFSQKISLFKTGRTVPAGKYKQLRRGNTIVMSNTPDEIRDFMHFVRRAKGHILINGLGLATVVVALLEKPEVMSITVVEKSEDVINLVAPHIEDARLSIVHADAFAYTPPKGAKYDYVWHDIWDYICSDNLPEMSRLHRKYGRRAGWQDSWAKSLCKRQLSRW